MSLALLEDSKGVGCVYRLVVFCLISFLSPSLSILLLQVFNSQLIQGCTKWLLRGSLLFKLITDLVIGGAARRNHFRNQLPTSRKS
jgi:hypothetical protein